MMVHKRTERLMEIVEAAKIGLYAGQIADEEALQEALSLGLIKYSYRGPLGFLGLAKLEIT